MTDPDTTPLWEASLDQIFDELERRFDHAVFAGLFVKGEESGYDRHRWKIGNAHTCAGLGLDVGMMAANDLNNRSE